MSSHDPRERLLSHGAAALSEVELVTLLHGTGSRARPASLIASQLLGRIGGLGGLRHITPVTLQAEIGVGPAKIARLIAAREIGRRLSAVPLPRGEPLHSSRAVAASVGPRLRDDPREHFLALALDSRNRPMRELLIATGGLTACALDPADIFRPLIQEAAAGVIFVHNHPSGDPEPSLEDEILTRRLVTAGELLGIRVLDHVIVGGDDHFSFADAGEIGQT